MKIFNLKITFVSICILSRPPFYVEAVKAVAFRFVELTEIFVDSTNQSECADSSQQLSFHNGETKTAN